MAHLEMVRLITLLVNNTMRRYIKDSPSSLANFDMVMCQSVFDYGSLTLSNLAKIGLVDTPLPPHSLLPLLEINKSKRMKNKNPHPPPPHKQHRALATRDAASKRVARGGPRGGMGGGGGGSACLWGNNNARRMLEGRFGMHDSYHKFDATKSVMLVRYLDMLNRRDKVEKMQGWINNGMHRLLGSSTATSMILSALGLWANNDASLPLLLLSLPWRPSKLCYPIAVVTVDGSSNRSCASQVISSFWEIKRTNRSRPWSCR
jgi:hypothetical protein